MHPPTKLERFVGSYFENWLTYAREEQKKQRSNNDDTITFEGFGKVADGAWEQWMEYVDEQLLPDADNKHQLDEEE